MNALKDIMRKEENLSIVITRLRQEKIDIRNGKSSTSFTIHGLNQTIEILKRERQKQYNRRHHIISYHARKFAFNKANLDVGMYVSFRDKGVRKIGVIQKVCPKTFVIKSGNEQWQINIGLVKPVRRIKNFDVAA